MGRNNTLEVTALPRKRNFLHLDKQPLTTKSATQQKQPTAKLSLLPRDNTTFDKLSLDDVEFSVPIPSLIHHIEKTLTASHLSTTILPAVGFRDLDIVVEALSASPANGSTNYQRLVFLADSKLKLIVAAQLLAIQSKWHEGYLFKVKRQHSGELLTLHRCSRERSRWLHSYCPIYGQEVGSGLHFRLNRTKNVRKPDPIDKGVG